ncbi:tRNA-splicing endonuclease subunit Sen15 [Phialemonium atrogriseum]|uniref:tRNA-splicing endonuclease subunit Sen15 n=1 Tax=Phialemonium atrogriseum TaxID=1093897 RepID=A0AAJ0FI27_9PEZI|nr:tRNA-splicing endonuclease subunit Sen15 [Phialemonium atrogriseum]KAK1769196.1 tRNA-splicing endonuclease subunit Sen15 [Phialemonium atrogriseum]
MALPEHLEALTEIVLNNLQNQHDWTELNTQLKPDLSRRLISGLPPRRLYVHPDEQIEIIKAEKNRKEHIPQPPEVEWVLPTHLAEKWSPKAFAAVFDAIDTIPPGAAPLDALGAEDDSSQWMRWRGPQRGKRMLLAIVQDDSTVLYYLMHDGIVKPRQN